MLNIFNFKIEHDHIALISVLLWKGFHMINSDAHITWGRGRQKQLQIHRMFTGELDFRKFYSHISFLCCFLDALQWSCIDESVKKTKHVLLETMHPLWLHSWDTCIQIVSKYFLPPSLSPLLPSLSSKAWAVIRVPASVLDVTSPLPLQCSLISSSCWLSLSQFPDQSRAEYKVIPSFISLPSILEQSCSFCVCLVFRPMPLWSPYHTALHTVMF